MFSTAKKNVGLLFGALVLLSGVSVSAQGQNPNLSPERTTLDIPAGNQYDFAQAKNVEGKEPATALGTALAATILPTGLGLLFRQVGGDNQAIRTTGNILGTYGLTAGPSMGNLYADDFLRGGLGILSRLGGSAMISYGLNEDLTRFFTNPYNLDKKKDDHDTLLGAGLVLFAGSAIYNIITSGASARAYNDRFSVRRGVEVETSPGLDPVNNRPVIRGRIHF